MSDTTSITDSSLPSNLQYDSLESLSRKSKTNDGLFNINTRPMGDPLSLDLNNREDRLSRWIIAYFIFVIAELTANSIDHRHHRAQNEDNVKAGYSLFIASDTFLFIGCILAWFSIQSGLDAAGFLYIDYIKYTACFLFILSAVLHWPAIHQVSHFMFCTDAAAGSYCHSYVFANHWMGHFFAILIGVDICDLRSQFFDNKRLRMFIYSTNIFLMYTILGSDVNYFYEETDNLSMVEKDTRNAVESGYFIVSLCCGFLSILILVSHCNLCTEFDMLNNSTFRSLFGLTLLVGTGLLFFTVNIYDSSIDPYPHQHFNTVLSFVPIVMIMYDLQTYHS